MNFFYANYNNLLTDRKTKVPGDVWSFIEETFAESSAHYLSKAAGIEKNMAFAYPDYLVAALPRTKKNGNV